MDRYTPNFKIFWLWMLEPPWRQQSEPDFPAIRQYPWLLWLISWAWTLSGLILGALVAPTLVKWAGLSNTQAQDGLVIGVAVLGSILVQLLSFCWFVVVIGTITWVIPMAITIDDLKRGAPDSTRAAELVGGNALKGIVLVLAVVLSVVVPFASVAYGIYRYLTWIGAGQRSITIAFVGGLLIKTFVVPAIWGAIKSKAFTAFMRWLRGDKVKPA